MSRMVKDFVEITDYSSLDTLIERLVAVRNALPNAGEAEVRMRGDDHFGRRLTVSFSRPQTAEEAEHEARCAHAFREARERSRREAERAREEEGHGRLRLVG